MAADDARLPNRLAWITGLRLLFLSLLLAATAFFYLRGELDVDPFISHRMGLDEVNRAFELMAEQDGIRSVLMYDGG